MRGPNVENVTMRLAYLILFAFSFATACGSCGSNGDAGEAAVTINNIDPAAGYRDVPITVSFSIEPGEGTNAGGMGWEVRFGDGTRSSGEGVEGAATHAYALPGQYDIEVAAVFEEETVGTAVAAVRVYSEVDLVIDGTRGAPANARVGENLQVSFTVTNNTAAEVFTPFEVAAFFSESPTVSPDEIDELVALGVQEIVPDVDGEPLIASGGERSAAFSVTVPTDIPSGDYHIVTVLDPRERIADTDRTNNLDVSSAIVRVENPEDALPDACVRQLYISPDRAFPQLNSITRGVEACNDGGQDAFDVVVKTYLSVGDAELDPASDILLDTTEPFDIFANSSVDVGPHQLVLDPGSEIVPTNGDVEVWVIVVVESDDPDADPTNNIVVSDFAILVTDEPVEGPDIVVRDFTVSPDSTFLNGSLNITAEIANEGTVNVGSFFCGIYLGAGPRVDTNADPRLTNVNIPSLDAGATTQVDTAITVPGLYDPGVYFFYIVCDPLNALQEPFRSNNAFIYPNPITVTDEADVDLFVETLTVPAAVDEGEPIELVARVCVQGSNPSGTTRAALYSNPGTQIDYNAEPLIQFDIPNILPGAENCLELPLEVEASCENFQDTYVFGLAVDFDNRLPETNETNNRKAGDNPVVVSGTFCQCEEDPFEPNDTPLQAVPLPEGDTSAAICTTGNCDYWGIDLTAGDSLIFTTTFESSKGALVTTLFDPSGLQVINTSSAPDVQQVSTFLVNGDGRYVVRVCGATAQDRNLYAMSVQVLEPSPGIDVLPRNFVLPFGDSFTIGETLATSLRVYNLGAVASGPFDVEIYLTPDPSTADDANNTLVASQQVGSVSASGILDVSIPATLPTTIPDGDYWLFAVLDPQGAIADTDPTNNRILSRQISVVTQCYDPLEPNDSFGQAAEITAGSYSNLQACTSQDDYYRLCLTTGKRFDVTVSFNDAEGDIDLELLNDQSVLIDSSANAQVDVEQVSWDFVNGDQCYTIRVYVIDNDPDLQTTYSMEVNVEDVDPALLCASVFEPNDSFATASSLTAAIGQSFALDRCPASDTDYYFVNLAAGQPVSLTATKDPAAQAGTLRIQLYQPNQTPGPNRETGPGVPSATISNYVPPTSGTYFVQITVAGATRNVTYRLSETGLGGIDLAPSNLVIGPGAYSAGEEVRFEFDLSNLRADNATSPPYAIYYSTSATHDAGADISMGSFTAPTVNGNTVITIAERANLPAGASDGARYLHVVVDPAGTTGDLNPSNNVATVPITIAP